MSNPPTALTPSQPIVDITAVVKEYPLGNQVVTALRGITLRIEKGEFTTIAGPSGSGKTTLLNLIGCIDVATRGQVRVAGQLTNTMSDKALTNLRLQKLGFIFQSFNLIQVLDAYQNVEFPLLLQGSHSAATRREMVESVIEKVGLKQYMHHRPTELSGGQRQRVAIARALVTRPEIVLADEPTANLDSVTGGAIIDLMRELNRTDRTTFIFSTHDHQVMSRADRIVRIGDGVVTTDERRTPESGERA